MSGSSTLEILLIVWTAVTVLFVGLLIYRSLVGMKEEDTLILSAAEAKMEEEQRLILTRLSQIRPYLLGLGWLSGVLLAAIVGLWVFQKLKETSFWVSTVLEGWQWVHIFVEKHFHWIQALQPQFHENRSFVQRRGKPMSATWTLGIARYWVLYVTGARFRLGRSFCEAQSVLRVKRNFVALNLRVNDYVLPIVPSKIPPFTVLKNVSPQAIPADLEIEGHGDIFVATVRVLA
jgi:hypothetical protein